MDGLTCRGKKGTWPDVFREQMTFAWVSVQEGRGALLLQPR